MRQIDFAKAALILEDASLELVPERFQSDESCRKFELRFGVPPALQILDDNYHHEIVRRLDRQGKRGRPDIVHLALLDAASTPVFQSGLLDIVVHTVNGHTVRIRKGTRLPRTLARFNGVFGKLLSATRDGKGDESTELLTFNPNQKIRDVVSKLGASRTIALTRVGNLYDLRNKVHMERERMAEGEKLAWIVGGFARGHFGKETSEISSELVAISKFPLPAHVVTSRLSYELERELLSE
jgi:rRNA small subunit pseudouridine methyltransferase Nep1